MEIWVLGSLEVVNDRGERVSLAGRRLRTLLIALALRPGEVVTDDQLIDALWGENEPSRGVNALQRQVSTLRRALDGDVVVRRGAGYVLAIERSDVDAFRFDALAERGHEAMRDGDAERGGALLEQALKLWRGEALAEVAYEEFAQHEISRLNEARIVATEARIDADLALGRETGLVGELEHLVNAYPLREHLRAQLMLALSRSGRQAEALRAYQSARAALRDELGLEPSTELRTLEAAILQQDSNVARPSTEANVTRPRNNLRTPLTSLIGRRADLDALRPVLRAERLVTLVGPGGVGKSRLVLEAAQEWHASEGADAWLVELAEAAHSDEIVPAIMAALGVPRAGSPAADIRRLVEFLRGRRALLVLDNCEHLVASTARVAQDLLESCPSLRIWATSREALAIPSEVLWPVTPLVLAAAVALFVERARAADPMATVASDSNRIMVQNICRRLDGLPLAIELAAARLRAIPIAELAAGLEDRFRLLNRGARTALPRQQTLRAVVDWSYDLLFDDERRVFARLSVFGGSCTLAAARVVCADDDIAGEDVAELVSRLADKSLVTIESDELEGFARCFVLQTLVDYGRERLAAAGETESVQAAHLRYYADFARRSVAALSGVKQRGWLRAVTANLGNLRAALEVAVRDANAESAQQIAGCLGWYWWFTGRAIEGLGWLRFARGVDGAVEDLTRARIMAWTAFALEPGFVSWAEPESTADTREPRTQGVAGAIDALCGDALALYRKAGVAEELGGVELALSVTYSTRGDHLRTRELVTEAEDVLATAEPTPSVVAMHAFARARRMFVEGRHADAEDAFRAAVAYFDGLDAQVYCAFALRYVGRLAVLRGDAQASTEAIERALDIARSLNLSGFTHVLMSDLAVSLGAAGAFARGREICASTLAAAREVQFLPGIRDALASLAMLEWRAGESDEATKHGEAALEVASQLDDFEANALCHALLGLIAGSRGEVASALVYHTRALELAQRASSARGCAVALEGLADIALREHDERGAARLLGASCALRKSPGGAAGSAFAAEIRVDVEALFARVVRQIGRDAATRALSEGDSNWREVVAALL